MAGKKKELTPPALEPSQTEIEANSLELASQSLEDQARKKLKPETILIVKKIAYYTSKVGLSLEESCMLVDIDFKKFQEDIKLEPLIGKIIRMKELEFKKDMLHTIASRARSGDDKLAAWLLSKKFPDEYGDKKRPEGNGDDVIFQAFEFIRKEGSTPLISETSGRAVVVKKTSKGLVEKIGDILSGTNSAAI